MEKIIRGTIILILSLVGIGFTHELMRRSPSEVVMDEELPKVKSKPKIKRTPSGKSSSLAQQAVAPPVSKVTESDSGNNPFNQNVERQLENETQEGSGNNEVSSSPGPNSEIYGNNYREVRPRKNPSSISKDSKSLIIPSKNSNVVNGPGIFLSNVGKDRSLTDDGSLPAEGNSSSSQGNDLLSCYASVGGGAFGNPIQVSLTCSASANIKYCVQEGSCCDPVSGGTTYTSPVVIGATDGSFCLSYYGESTNSKTSYVYEHSYAISNTYPDLQISFPKIFYQTTQLSGYNLLRSNDFSKPNYWIGEINLKTHDPGPAALNLSCEDIVEDFMIFPLPTPVEIFSPMDMALIGSGSQLNVPLVLAKLDYGENFITSFVVNNNYAAPIYSCSTTKLTLSDFDYFVPEASHGDVGTNTGREFSGSFVAYSFFEPTPVVYRTPAGAANEDNLGQELRVGSFAVFY